MGQIAFKFVKWDVPELATLKDCKVYRLRECFNNGGKLTRDDKNWITEQVRGCCVSIRSTAFTKNSLEKKVGLKRNNCQKILVSIKKCLNLLEEIFMRL